MGIGVVQEKYFRKEMSLKDSFEDICNPMTKLTPPLLIDFTAKYFHCYRRQNDPSQILNLDDVNRSFRNFKGIYLDGEDRRPVDSDLYLPIKCLGDIPANIPIIRSLDVQISRFVKKNRPTEFNSLDIGIGSGILSIISLIVAKKRGIKDIFCYGIENNPHVCRRTQWLVSELGLSQNFDIRFADAYDLESYPNIYPDIILNETIPNPNSDMTKEAFIPICAVVQKKYGSLDKTMMFPPALRLVRNNVAGIYTTLSSANNFTLGNNTPLESLFPDSISLFSSNSQAPRFVKLAYLRIESLLKYFHPYSHHLISDVGGGHKIGFKTLKTIPRTL